MERLYSPYSFPLLAIKKATAETIAIELVCDAYELDINTLKSRTRKREYVVARQIVFSLLKKYTKRSLASIGSVFKRDHATVIHSIKNICNLCETEKNFREIVETIEDVFQRKLNTQLYLVDEETEEYETVGSYDVHMQSVFERIKQKL
jgi:hypothetical protein